MSSQQKEFKTNQLFRDRRRLHLLTEISVRIGLAILFCGELYCHQICSEICDIKMTIATDTFNCGNIDSPFKAYFCSFGEVLAV